MCLNTRGTLFVLLLLLLTIKLNICESNICNEKNKKCIVQTIPRRLAGDKEESNDISSTIVTFYQNNTNSNNLGAYKSEDFSGDHGDMESLLLPERISPTGLGSQIRKSFAKFASNVKRLNTSIINNGRSAAQKLFCRKNKSTKKNAETATQVPNSYPLKSAIAIDLSSQRAVFVHYTEKYKKFNDPQTRYLYADDGQEPENMEKLDKSIKANILPYIREDCYGLWCIILKEDAGKVVYETPQVYSEGLVSFESTDESHLDTMVAAFDLHEAQKYDFLLEPEFEDTRL